MIMHCGAGHQLKSVLFYRWEEYIVQLLCSTKPQSIVGGVRDQSKGGAVCRLLLIAGKAALTHNNTALNQELEITT